MDRGLIKGRLARIVDKLNETRHYDKMWALNINNSEKDRKKGSRRKNQ